MLFSGITVKRTLFARGNIRRFIAKGKCLKFNIILWMRHGAPDVSGCAWILPVVQILLDTSSP